MNAVRQACAAVLMLQLLGACSGGSEEALCQLSVEYDGQTYFEVHVDSAPKLGGPLGEATVPHCIDTNLESPGPPSIVTVRRISGVDPDAAIAWQDNILLANGLTALSSPRPTK